MNELWASPFFGIAVSILAFWIGVKLQEWLKSVLCNPLLIAIVLIAGLLSVFHIPYESYNAGGAIINMFLAPATACLAVSIYSKIQILKENWLPIVVGCTVGSVTSMGSVYLLCRTTPIAVEVSAAHGGIVPVTVIAVIFTGILGSIFAPLLIRIFQVKDPVAAGLSIGACSHAVGTSRAVQLGETQGAMSGLAIGICGIITVIVSMVFMY